MNELQKIALGLLSMSHPEIYMSRSPSAGEPSPIGAPSTGPTRGPKPLAKALHGLKFAIAALLAGARAIPLGDNGCITRELGEYGTHLNGC
jgi:hypothetical protein